MKVKNVFLIPFILLLSDACVDRLFFDLEDANRGEFVVDGFITDQPGPYTVKIFKTDNFNDNLLFPTPFVARRVIVSDNQGNAEVMEHRGEGVYVTQPDGIRGMVGRKYNLRIELLDGSIIESTSDEMPPVKNIDSLYYEFESFLPRKDQTQYGFRIFIDTKHAPNGYVRWRYTGTYIARAYPEYYAEHRCTGDPAPLPCSGQVYEGVFPGGYLKRIAECTCCNCWVQDTEEKPHVSSDLIPTGGFFKKVNVGYVPFESFRFINNKYMIKVEQMSLSQDAYEFWKTIKDQKEGASSLFQPAFGTTRTNFYSTNGTHNVKGFFYASSVKQRILFLTGAEAPIPVPREDLNVTCFFVEACDVVFDYLNGSRTPPPEWE